MNKITIELCAEDRARLDKLTAALESCKPAVFGADLAQAPTVPAEDKIPEVDPQDAQEGIELEETAAAPEQAPEEKKEPAVTLEQIQQKVVQLAAQGGDAKAKARQVISAYGSKVSDLKEQPEKWDEVWAKLVAVESEG